VKMPLLGAHMSISGGLEKALLRGEACGCQVIQIFTRNPNQWGCSPLSSKEIDAFHAARIQTSIMPVAAHDSYLINLASPHPENRRRSLEALQDELARTDRLGIPCVVIHPGAHMGEGEHKGIRRIAEGLNRIFDHDSHLRVHILLETTAGQGTSLGYRFEHLAEIIRQTESQERLGVCLDTCHIFAAGYDIRTRPAYLKTMRRFDAILGIQHLHLIHLNDSKRDLGSRVDRHAHIGKGCIGLAAFGFFMNDKRLRNIPKIIETEKGTDGTDWDRINLECLRGLIKKRPGFRT